MSCWLAGVGDRISRVESFFLVLATVVGVAYVYGLWNLSFAPLLSNVGLPLESFVAFLLAAISIKRKEASKFSLGWTGYTVGMFLWFLAEAIWAVYSLFLGIETPYPSIADAFWLAGYLPFLVGMVVQVWPFRKVFSSKAIILGLIASLGLAIVAVAVLVPPILGSPGQDTLTVGISVAYPLLDGSLLVVGVPILLVFREGTFWKPMLYVVIGLILTFVADTLFGWASLLGIFYTGHPIDMVYQWSYLTLALGFYLRAKQVASLNRT